MKKQSGNHSIIFFDGTCNLCNASVNFIIRRDKAGFFRFASLQSKIAVRFFGNSEMIRPDSLVLVEDGKIYFRSEAVLQIVRKMPGLWKTFIIFKIIPLSWRDRLYDFVAKNRYKWFGKRQSCMVPTAENSKRFLSKETYQVL